MPDPPPSSPGRRARRRAALRATLYETAVTLFVEHGYAATSFGQIAAAADVARATVFNYFPRKDDILLAWGEERRREIGVTILQECTRGPGLAGRLLRCMRVLAEREERDRHVTRALLPAWVRTGAPVTEPPYIAYSFAQVVSEGVARGEVRADVDPMTAGVVLRDLYLGTLYRWAGGDAEPPFPLGPALAAATEIVLSGVLTGPAPARA
ncbi:TetR/AcrR family transcriptional regulator [Actinomadura flavalba]|uniref:TetR/AcrR family transcriptional regulator n=1 Tax=Actinomadura flavalba TaxID=1120938 RepID=UPI0003607B18|nr:TetR/AcrR family transcriptional regulator [Actinomadura flavalba]